MSEAEKEIKKQSNAEKGKKKEESESYDVDWLKGTSAESLVEKKNTGAHSHPVYKKLSKINGEVNSMSMNELAKTLDELDLDSNGKKEVLQKRLKNHYKEVNLKSSNIKDGFKCRFDYVCVIDFEATCTATKQEEYPHEIIEFPIVMVNMKTLEIDDSVSFYCKPVINPKLTKFCTELTGITQEQVDNGEEFPIVLKKVKNWLAEHELGTKYKYAIATDGPWDMQNFLNLQCHLADLCYPRWARKWIDIRKLFSNYLGVKRCNINNMLDFYGFKFEGQPHCGLDDAKNIARILIRLAKDGCHIKINANIKNCRTEIEKLDQNENNSSDDDHLVNDNDLEFNEQG